MTETIKLCKVCGSVVEEKGFSIENECETWTECTGCEQIECETYEESV